MTDETKILFEQLADAINANQIEINRIVEAINSPDWWIIGITAVNAVIMVALRDPGDTTTLVTPYS